MTSVNVTTQSNTVTVQQGDATTVTIATQGPQGPAGDGAVTINNNGTSKVITGSGTANTLNANVNLTFDGTTLDVKSGTGVINTGQGTFNGDVTFTGDSANVVFDKSDNALDFADNAQLRLGSAGEVKIFHTGSATNFIVSQHFFNLQANGYFFYNQAGNETLLSLEQNGAVKLYHDNIKRLETTSTGITVTGNINLPDSTSNAIGRIMLGDGTDMQIQHDGGGGFIGNFTGNLTLHCNALRFMNGAKTETFISANENGAVELYHDNVKKIETTSSGITVTGSVTTQDMNMSNLNGTANEVDGSKGSWSIQEGADDLFLINRVSGKKYKFNLTEVS